MSLVWRLKLYNKVKKYIDRDAIGAHHRVVMNWWKNHGSEILNEIEEVIDQQKELAQEEILKDVYVAIKHDGNINHDDINTIRALRIIEILIRETQQEVEYEEDQTWKDHKRSQEDA